MGNKKRNNRWIIAVAILLVVVAISYIAAAILSMFIGGDELRSISSGNVAIIPIKGLVATAKSPMFLGQQIASSTEITKAIKKAEESPNIKAIILEIDSNGGTPVATDEVAQAVKDSKKFTVAWVREMGVSGAYWIASSADIIVANRMSVVGSIGVIGSYLQFEGLFDKYGVTYERMVGGKYKDIGTPFKKMTFEEKALMQNHIDSLHNIFLREVRTNRNLSWETVNEISTGIFFTGKEAKELGLVDILGGKNDALKIIEISLNITPQTVEIKKRKGFADIVSLMFGDATFHLGQGIGSVLLSQDYSVRI